MQMNESFDKEKKPEEKIFLASHLLVEVHCVEVIITLLIAISDFLCLPWLECYFSKTACYFKTSITARCYRWVRFLP